MPGYIEKFFNFFRRNANRQVSTNRAPSFYELFQPFISVLRLFWKVKTVIRAVPKDRYSTCRADRQTVLTLKAPFLPGYLRKAFFHSYYFYWTISNAGTALDTFFRVYSKVDHLA